MSSGASASNTTHTTPNSLNTCDEKEATITDSVRLINENAELRKLVRLMQENLELRVALKSLEKTTQTMTPVGQQEKDHKDIKDRKEKSNSSHLERVKQCQRIVGEIAFQLDRRILCAIFLEQERLYGYRVADIEEKILQVTTCPLTGKVEENLRSKLYMRYHHTISQLKKLGYNSSVHLHFTEYLVNTYGIVKNKHLGINDLSSFNDPEHLRKMIMECMPSDKVNDILIILNCLIYFAKEDGKFLLIW